MNSDIAYFARMQECKSEGMSHIYEECFGKSSDQNSIKYGLGGSMGSRADSVKQYKKFKNKWKKDLKALMNQHKIIYSIINKSGSRRELKNINNIKAKYSKKRYNSIIDSSSGEYYSNSSLSNNSD